VTKLSTRPRMRSLIARGVRSALATITRSGSETATKVSTSEDAPQFALQHRANDALASDPRVSSTDSQPAVDADRFARGLRPGLLGVEQATVTQLLFERLTTEDVGAIEQLLRDTPGAWDHYARAGDEAARRNLLLALGMWVGAESVVQKTGLVRAEPPEDVHAMTRGALTAAGGLYEADFIVDALLSAGAIVSEMHSALDFGCSSGRVVRSLAAAYPDIAWYGCDPNARAIAWAKDNLAGIEFFVNGDAPPLPLAESSLDLVYAISIWSHFAPPLGLRWFEEMHRLIKPGGHLICTTHGLTSVDYYATRAERTAEQSKEIADSLYRDGFWYAPEFGTEGDWGVVNPDWGTAFLSPEWLLTQLCPRWRVLEFAPGRNQENQDVYVLQRV
jgi:SAM-dependent methyltransferase